MKNLLNKESGELSEYFLRIIENSKDILYLIDGKSGKFEYVSPSTKEISGFTVDEITEMGMEGINKRAHPDDMRAIEHRILDMVAKGLVPNSYCGNIEIRFRHKAGHYVWLGISRNFITDNNGRIIACVGNIRDITEVKHLQQQLESALENYKTLYNNARVALFRTRIGDGKFIECNDYMANLLGYKDRQDCLDKCFITKHHIDIKNRNEFIKLLKEKKQVDNFELKGRRLDGRELWIKISAKIYPDRDYLEGAVKDVTISKILTNSENKILRLILEGKSSKEIAFQLKRSVRTIEDHRSHIMQKLEVGNIIELTKKAAAEFTLNISQ